MPSGRPGSRARARRIAILAPARSFCEPRQPPGGGGDGRAACWAAQRRARRPAQNLLRLCRKVDDAADAMTEVLTPRDLERFRDGSHCDLHRVLGAHRADADHVRFAVWAPNAERVSVVGDFNAWRAGASALERRAAIPRTTPESGKAAIADVDDGARYKYHVESRHGRLSRGQGRSVRVLLGRAARHGVARLAARLRLERRRVAAQAQRARTRSTRRGRSTRCTSGSWRRRDGAGARLSRARRAADRARDASSASRTSSSCRSWSIRSTARGAIRRSATSRRRRATARRRISST